MRQLVTTRAGLIDEGETPLEAAMRELRVCHPLATRG
jgi:hypothetical protein